MDNKVMKGDHVEEVLFINVILNTLAPLQSGQCRIKKSTA